MALIPAYGYFFKGIGQPLERLTFSVPEPAAHEVVVAVAGCGLCHTDLSFLSGAIRTNAPLPLILGHEISGRVVGAGRDFEKLIGTDVIVPAVLPCGECALCKEGRSNVCRGQKMPGNDFNGGFASHIAVAGRYLCAVPVDIGNFRLFQLSVIADAVTTPYQSLMRSNLKNGDLAIVVGVGGIGIFMVQFAARAGAEVIALDIDDAKIERAKRLGARIGINTKGMEEKGLKEKVRAFVNEKKLPEFGWKIFETSGTAAGQGLAFSLLSFAGALAVVGFTKDKITVRLSNLMALDADMFGNWGCKPEYYPTVLHKVLKNEINILDVIEERPMDSINEVISLAMRHGLEKRVVFIP
jgi:6-hydroxycyclohex-1-ene-1-carbonyl-CoA dehydrogenase